MAIGQTVNGKRIWGEAGRFQVYDDGTFAGPAEYIGQVKTDKILADASLLAGCAPAGTTVYQLFAVALQTDYAAWVGMREMMAWGTK